MSTASITSPSPRLAARRWLPLSVVLAGTSSAAALVLAPRLIPDSQRDTEARLDPAGTLLASAALTALVLPLVEGRQHGWPVWTWLSLAATPVLVAALIMHQRGISGRGASPSVNLGLFRTRSFSAGLLTQVCFWAGQASFFVILALYLQQGRGLKPSLYRPGWCSRSWRSPTWSPRPSPPGWLRGMAAR